MRNKLLMLFLFCSCVFTGIVAANTAEVDYRRYFDGFRGAFVLYDRNHDTYLIYNKVQAEKRLSPESTFKIFNALAGLQSGIVKDETTEFRWDGAKYDVASWNQNQTLATAMSASVIWCFQNIARQVGPEPMKAYLQAANYGNGDVSGGIDKFWLDTTLKISALEQVEFLDRFLRYDLPFDREGIDIVKKVLILEQKNDRILSGKTGSSGGGWLSHVDAANHAGKLAWFVGYLTTPEDTYLFATNIEGVTGASGVKAKEITKAILARLDLF